MTNRPLRVFLCHSSNDKPAVRELYQKLCAEAWIQPWLDEEELFPGDDWDLAIEKAVEKSDVVLVCLSNGSINKRGYVQKELRFALDIALEIPEEEIFIVPLRLEECIPPRSLRDWQYADYFEGQRDRSFQKLLVSLQRRADSLGLKFQEPASKEIKKIDEKGNSVQVSAPKFVSTSNNITLSNGIELLRIPNGKFLMGTNDNQASVFSDEKPQHTVNIPYDYWMARYPVTNELYNIYIKFRGGNHPVEDWQKKKEHPVVHISWNNAVSYCQWLNDLFRGELPSSLVLRLPTEAEWEKAARGTDGREYPWGNGFDAKKCNIPNVWSNMFSSSSTTPVTKYSPTGDSPYACADMIGNVAEWTHSKHSAYPYKINDEQEYENTSATRITRGGVYSLYKDWHVSSTFRRQLNPDVVGENLGFRICLAPPLPK